MEGSAQDVARGELVCDNFRKDMWMMMRSLRGVVKSGVGLAAGLHGVRDVVVMLVINQAWIWGGVWG